jgi:hypothetical protein
MSDNIWQRFKLLLTRELNNAYEDATEAALRCVIRAAEDAEREQPQERPAFVYEDDEPLDLGEPVQLRPQGLPPLDETVVEVCIAKANAYVSRWDGLRAALTHYRERVERPLREELDTYQRLAKNDTDALFDERDKRGKVEAEADRLRAELNQYDERGHDARNEIEGLRAELAALKAQPADAEQLARRFHDTYERLAPSFGYETRDDTKVFDPASKNGRLMVAVCGELGEFVKARPAESGERQRLIDMARYYGGQSASGLVHVRADDMRRIATLLESPAPARESLGRRWAVLHPDGRFYCTSDVEASAQHDARYIGGTVIECDLVPVEGEP